jgi:hypothetical protein
VTVPPYSATRSSSRTVLAAVCVAVLAIAGCGPADTSPAPQTPGATGSPRTAPPPSPASPSPAPVVSPPSQTETEWGAIWDELPPEFPLPPGVAPAELRGEPASGVFTVPVPPGQAATYMQAALEGAGYSTRAMSGPYEDGSIVIDSVGSTPECMIQTTLAPLGGSTVLTVLFGAGCPFG